MKTKAEIEIGHEVHADDPAGKKVGLLAAVLAVSLAVVTILSHRSHTEAVVKRTEGNDQWAFYQAKSIKSTVLGAAEDLMLTLEPGNEKARSTISKYEADRKRYEEETKEIQDKAKEFDSESQAAEHRAFFYDLGEGLIEIGLVMTSLYFIGRKQMFPTIAILAGICGICVALYGAFLSMH